MWNRAQTKIQGLWQRLCGFLTAPRSKTAFLTTGVCSVLAYLYYLGNLISNNDMISVTPYGAGASITSGRWALLLLSEAVDCLWGGHYNVPAFNILLALVLVAMSSALLLRVLEIRKTGLCVALSAVTATIPALGSTMFFAYSVQYYTLAILLMVVAVYFLKKEGFLPFCTAVLCGCFSLGIYQAYLPFFAVVLLLDLIARTMDSKNAVGYLLLRCWKYLVALVLSYLLYSLVLQAFLGMIGQELSNYQGINTMGTVHLSGILTAVKDVLRLPVCMGYYGFNSTPVICFGIGVCFLCSVGIMASGKKLPLWNTVLLVVLLLCFVVAVNSTHILAGDSVLYTRMTLGLIGIFYLPLMLCQQVSFRKESVRKGFVTVLVAVLLLCSANYAWQSNGNYMSVEYSNRKAENYFASMFTRIRSAEGYKEELPIVYVGQTIQDSAYVDNWLDTPFAYTGRMGAKAQLNQYSRDNFIRNYLGYEWRQITAEEQATYADLIEQMPCYPDDRSITVTPTLILIRLE